MTMDQAPEGTATAQLIRAFNSGYKSGHHDTVEGQYTDIDQRDMFTYHADVIAEMVADGTLAATAAVQPTPIDLPPLPAWTALSITTPNQYKTVECLWSGQVDTRKAPLFTADQMRAYAIAAIAARQAEPHEAAIRLAKKQRSDPKLAGPGATARERFLLAQLDWLQGTVLAARQTAAEAPNLAVFVLAWWEDHQYDTASNGDGEYNIYDDEPVFVKLAKSTAPP